MDVIWDAERSIFKWNKFKTKSSWSYGNGKGGLKWKYTKVLNGWKVVCMQNILEPMKINIRASVSSKSKPGSNLQVLSSISSLVRKFLPIPIYAILLNRPSLPRIYKVEDVRK